MDIKELITIDKEILGGQTVIWKQAKHRISF